jgi:hypothetical protein
MLVAMLTFMLYKRENYTRGYSYGRWVRSSRPQGARPQGAQA